MNENEHVVLYLELVLFWADVRDFVDQRELEREENCSHEQMKEPTFLKLVQAIVLTMHPSDEKKVGMNVSAKTCELQLATAKAGASIVSVQDARAGQPQRQSSFLMSPAVVRILVQVDVRLGSDAHCLLVSEREVKARI